MRIAALPIHAIIVPRSNTPRQPTQPRPSPGTSASSAPLGPREADLHPTQHKATAVRSLVRLRRARSHDPRMVVVRPPDDTQGTTSSTSGGVEIVWSGLG